MGLATMTSPTQPVVLPMMPGVDQTALAPLLAALQERKARQVQQEQIMVQQGQLSLQQEEFKAKQQELAQQRKALEQQGQAFKQGLGELSAPGPIESELQAAAQTGDRETMEFTMKRISRQLKLQELATVKQKYIQAAQAKGGFAPTEQANMLREFLVTDPDNPNAGAWANAANQLEAAERAQRTAANQWVKGQAEKQVDGTFHNVWYDKMSGERRVGGQVATPYTALIQEQGTSKQQDMARVATQMRLAQRGVTDLEDAALAQNRNIETEIAPVLAKLEAAGNLPIKNMGNVLLTIGKN